MRQRTFFFSKRRDPKGWSVVVQKTDSKGIVNAVGRVKLKRDDESGWKDALIQATSNIALEAISEMPQQTISSLIVSPQELAWEVAYDIWNRFYYDFDRIARVGITEDVLRVTLTRRIHMRTKV